jgi:hypothetical protein
MNTWNDIEHGFGPARATQYTVSDADQLAATLYKLFHGRYVKSDNGHVITLSDGRHITITLGDGNTGADSASTGTGAHGQDMRAHADRRIIERAHLHTNTNHAGTITGVSLILFYQGETTPSTIRTAYADITTGTFATPRDKSKPLATIRVALIQTQINEWVNREQQALANMLVGETIVSACDGVFTLAPRDNDNSNDSESDRNGDNKDVNEAGATNAGDANTVTVRATLNNQPRNNKGSRHATTITLTGGNTIGPITHAWVTRTRVQDTREQPTNADKTQPMTENTTITGDDNNNVTATTRRGRRETTVITLHATTPDNPTPIALYTSVYSGRTAHHGLTIEHSNGTVVNGEAAATHTTIRLPHK